MTLKMLINVGKVCMKGFVGNFGMEENGESQYFHLCCDGG